MSGGSFEEVAEEEEELGNGKHILRENQLQADTRSIVQPHREMVENDTAETFQGDLPASQIIEDEELKEFMTPARRSSAFEAPKR